MKKIVRTIAAMVVVFLAAGMMSVVTLAAEVSTIGVGAKRETMSFAASKNIQLQFNVTKTVSEVGITIGSNSDGKAISLKLFKWMGNPQDTIKTVPVASQKLTSWNRGSVISLKGSFSPGEYLFDVVLEEGPDIRVDWFSKSITGTQGYIRNDFSEGTPNAIIVFEDGSADGFAPVSKSNKENVITPPKENEIVKEGAIEEMNVDSTLWSYIDGLGRPSVTFKEAGKKNNKKVGMFYWTWFSFFKSSKPNKIKDIIAKYPDARNDFNHKAWKEYNEDSYFWEEPIWGYYTNSDAYVYRKQAEMLADAGVDFVVFDCTNGTLTFEDAYMNLLEAWSLARKDGVNTPQIAFMLPFFDDESANVSLHRLFDVLYSAERYKELWFYWEGKPLIMARQKALNANNKDEKVILDYFTFKAGYAGYFDGDQSSSYWGWLHVYPQALYKREDGSVEMTTVGVAENANYKKMEITAMNGDNPMGRSFSMQKDYKYTYTYKGKEIVCSSSMENSVNYGINFQEQWDYAISQNPDLIFVTGWNEWLAQRFEHACNTANAFQDEYDDEYSRDIEPTKGALKDHYYYQLVSNIRRFKGMTEPSAPAAAKTINPDGGFEQWNDDSILKYNTYKNNTLARNEKGFKSTLYTNDATRNDFISAKVSYDSENIYFYVECLENITGYTDANWMRLLINTGELAADSMDWEGFEYIVGRETGTESTLALEKSIGGWNFEKIADVKYKVVGKEMMVVVPRSALGIKSDDFTLNFKWADANLADGDILSLYTDGDAAPMGRFCFVLNTTAGSEEKNDGKKGCFGVLSGGAAIISTLSAGAIICKKRKENDE